MSMVKMPPGMAGKVAAHMAKNKLLGRKRFPMVLMLEPLHLCNFTCTGCGRIREYESTIKEMMSLEECLEAVAEVDTPIVSICGGEPLIYPHIGPLTAELQRQGRYVILCTNAWLMKPKLSLFKPDRHLVFQIHLDGMATTHDAVVERPGSFDRAIEAIRVLKANGFQVAVNCTLYKQTPSDEVIELCDFVTGLGIDGILLSPAYTYEVVDQEFYMKRDEIIARFQELAPRLKGAKLWNTPIYMKFLTGAIDMECTPWGGPTRNPRGWRGPCYQIGEAHYRTFKDMMEQVDWGRFVKRQDDRCASCMTHCGFEHSSALRAWSPQGALEVLQGW
jgi:hopanoid biosynthesis associated radical SAM protein HpnH